MTTKAAACTRWNRKSETTWITSSRWGGWTEQDARGIWLETRFGKRKSDDVVVSQWWRLMTFEIKATFGACWSVWVFGANIVTTKNKWVKTNRKWIFLCGRAQLSNPQAIFLVLSGLQSKIKKIFFNFYFQLKITQNWAFLCQRATIL